MARSITNSGHPAWDHQADVGLSALDAALICGSDERLALDPSTGMNGYGCGPKPRNEEISFSSSTASTISPNGYAAAAELFRAIEGARSARRLASVCQAASDDIRVSIGRLFELGDVDVILSPSGTDCELLALFLASRMMGKRVVNVVVAADETGSGVPIAAGGRHFGNLDPGGRPVAKGQPIDDIACDTVLIPVRNEHGDLRPSNAIDDDVADAIRRITRSGGGAVLHLMDHSKTGNRYPSPGCVDAIRARCDQDLCIVVDACQGRLGRARLQRYLDQNFLVLITGSKFFAGPPLSGALLAPDAISARCRAIDRVPAGLASYTNRHDWPHEWGGIRRVLPDRANVGQLLRWRAAVAEIGAYFAVPDLFRRLALSEFAAVVARVAGDFPGIRILPEQARPPDDDEFAARTIFPFVVTVHGRPLSYAQARTIFCALNLSPPNLGLAGDVEQPCHIGQPVSLAAGSIGALRISADARLASQSWTGSQQGLSIENVRRTAGQVRTVFEKVRHLVRQFDGPERCSKSAARS